MANNLKQSPIPVVPRTMKIVNPDGTVTRSGQLLLEQLQQAIIDAGGGGEPDDGGPDAEGPVTGFTSVAEVGTRYADDPDRLVHMTVGFIPIVPTPQPVTYLISADNGATWVWIGSQRMREVGQMLRVDRLAPGEDSQWRVAAIAGNIGGDPSPILDVNLDTLYPGVVRSVAFPVLGLYIPIASTGITATIGVCTNVVTADGLTQYGQIPGVVYTDPAPGSTTAFFVRITVQIYDSTGAPLAAEQPHGGTQITGGSHTEADLLITYVPGLSFVRYRFYLANRNSQGSGDFSDPSTNTLQMVRYNGGAPANHYDVPITIPPFTPIDPSETFNVLSVSASEVGPKYQDTQAGLHTTIGVIPVIDADYSSPRTVTLWFDFGTGSIVWQGWYALTAAGDVVRIGDSTLGTDGVRKSGDIWVPANTAQGNWIVYCAPGRVDKGINPTGASFPFVVTPVTSCLPNGTTNCHFVNVPATGDPIIYSLWDPGIWYWEYYQLTWVPPSIAQDPNFWFAMITVQKGATIGGVWTPAPDSEGINEDPTGNFLGRVHDQILQLPGLANDQSSTMRKFGAKPATWVIPPLQNPDGTPNPYREFRFLMYNVSRLGTDTSGSGGAGTYTLQTSCWQPGNTDHFILTPQPQAATLDIRAANPLTITLPLVGGNGQPLTIKAGEITSPYLADDSVQAQHMAANSITVANDALAAEVVIDPKIKTVGINKVTYGTSVFAGDVVLTRGIGNPVIYLKIATSGPDPLANPSGIYLFGQSDPADAAKGMTSKPYAVFQSNGLSFFSGGTGPQILLNSTGLTMWVKQGDVNFPYYTVNATAMSFVNKTSSMAINANALNFSDSTNGNTLDMNSAGMSVANGNNKLVITSSILQLQFAGSARVTISTAGGVVLSNGGTSSVTITSSAVNIVNGAISVSNPDYTINIDNANGIKVLSTVNNFFFQVIGLSAGAGGGILAQIQNVAGDVTVSQRIRVVTGASYGELTLSGTGSAVSIGTAGVLVIRPGTSPSASAGSASLPSNPVGFIMGTFNGATIRIPYYN